MKPISSLDAMIDSPSNRTLQATPTYRLARLISNIGSPPVIALLAVILVVFTASDNRQVWWGLLYIVVAILIPLFYVLDLVRRGKVTDFHLSSREERTWPFIVTIGVGIIAWLILLRPTVSQTLQLVALINIVQTALLSLITTQWKISVHSAAITGLAVLAWHLIGNAAIFLFLCIPLIAWSRLHLKRHTPLQLIAGATLGATVVYSTILAHGF